MIGAKWFGFHDPHSSIDHYEWCAGTVQLDNLVPWTQSYTEEVAVTSLSSPLPTDKRIYTTVKAYNRAGLWVVASSDGFVVDTTPPNVIRPPMFEVDGRSLKDGTQYSRSVLQASWKFRDDESPVKSHVLAVSARHNAMRAADPIVLGSERSGGFSQPTITLVDGERYYPTVTACNAAGQCSRSSSRQSLLVDGSPPLVGSFTDYIQWRSENSSTTIHIRFSQFSDVHSGVVSYLLSVGRTYSGMEYTPSYVEITHLGADDNEQNATVTLQKSMAAGNRLYLSLYAINGVGLRSKQVQISAIAQTTSGSSGLLVIEKHSCVVSSCLGHCTCAPSGGLCDNRLFGSSCTKVVRLKSALLSG